MPAFAIQTPHDWHPLSRQLQSFTFPAPLPCSSCPIRTTDTNHPSLYKRFRGGNAEIPPTRKLFPLGCISSKGNVAFTYQSSVCQRALFWSRVAISGTHTLRVHKPWKWRGTGDWEKEDRFHQCKHAVGRDGGRGGGGGGGVLLEPCT